MLLNTKKYNLILASKSPRRKQLMEQLGYEFTQLTKDIDESFPDNIPANEVAEYLSRKKAEAFKNKLGNNDLVITSDTIVIHESKILGKPKNEKEAQSMLQKLSGKTHEVVTGVCLQSKTKIESFSVITIVEFDTLKNEEIDYYIKNYQPFDKAGSYGIQEWVGLIGVKNIIGSFYNVMGFPTKEVYEAIEGF